MARRPGLVFLVALALVAAPPARASFHEMQIERVIAGVDGDLAAQAVQLRMRDTFQNQVQAVRLYVRDSTGANPILLVDLDHAVPNQGVGVRILIATPAFGSYLNPPIAPDFVMTSPIPAGDLAAGTLTYETDPPFPTVYWRLSWGGAHYTGPGDGNTTNDADGLFSPPFVGPLPSSSLKALQFKFAAAAPSTDNANDYALTSGAAVFANNAGDSAIVARPESADAPSPPAEVVLGPPTPNPASASLGVIVTLPRAEPVRLEVIDVRGRIARRLFDRALPAGRHPLALSLGGDGGAARLPSGTYWLRLTAGAVRRSRTFTLIR